MLLNEKYYVEAVIWPLLSVKFFLLECSYYEGLQRGLGLIPDGKVYTSKQVEKLVEVYSNLRVQYPRSAAAKVRFQKHTVFGSRL